MSAKLVHTDPDIFLIEVPSAHAVLEVTNCYLIKGDCCSLLVDVGGESADALNTLEEGIASAGVSAVNLEFFLTHHHVDHIFNLDSLAHPGATVFTSKISLEKASAEYLDQMNAQLRCRFMKEGFARQEAEVVVYMRQKSFGQFDRSSFDVRAVGEGDVIHVGGYRYIVVGLPGHSEGQIGLYQPERQILISGDQVIYELMPVLDVFPNGYQSNIDVLRRLRKLPVKTMLQGHGAIRASFNDRIDQLVTRNLMKAHQALDIIERNPGILAREAILGIEWSALKSGKTIDDLDPVQRHFILASGMTIIYHLIDSGMIEEREGADGYLHCYALHGADGDGLHITSCKS